MLILLPPILVHEAGHWLFMQFCGVRADALCLETCGLCMRYHGAADRREEILIAAAGPLFGLLYAAVFSRFPGRRQLSAGISLLLSLYNLLPVRPLDGGRIAGMLLTESAAHALSLFTALSVISAGAALFLTRRGASLLFAGCFLMAAQLRRDL